MPKKKKKKFRIQTHDSVMCGYFCIGFIDCILISKTLIDYTNLCLLYGFKKNDKIILGFIKNG